MYALVAIVRKELGLALSPYRMLQTISVMPFEQVPLYELFSESLRPSGPGAAELQLQLFET